MRPGLFGRSLLLRLRPLLSFGALARLLLGLSCPLTLRLFGARLRLFRLLTSGRFALPLFLGALLSGFLGPISLRVFGLWFLLLGPTLLSLLRLGTVTISLLPLLRCWLFFPLILCLLRSLCSTRLLRLLLFVSLRTPLFAWLLWVALRTGFLGFLRLLLLAPLGATFFSLLLTRSRLLTRLRGSRVCVL